MASSSLAVISTIAVVLAVLSTLTPSQAGKLTEHQLMLLQGGGLNGKRSQTGMRPQHYLNLMDGAEGSEEFEREPVENLMAGYLARLSPGKRHMLSKLLEVARMDNELSDE
ncbi:uncharacterized protein LOC110977375 isoform X1 [Acanthaster planci]|uniref:Uncharacterized protein LOC110977375 isoform X1 n=1 Tax=Acanthaster planci TaxID=133434 RepID=A0A8B7Y5L3_ACAPL|nr:uncharacterized protein LOC110977375 isoform X1 [Acanthaster planci]